MTRMHAQRGAVLLVALIMLVLLTLFALSALNTSTTNLKMVGNMQARSEATNAAQDAIEAVISKTELSTTALSTTTNCAGASVANATLSCSGVFGTIMPVAPQFILTPANAVAGPCGAPNTLCIDKDGKNVTDPSSAYYTIKLLPTPKCVMVTPLKNNDPKLLADPSDQSCGTGQAQQFGVAGAVTGDSLCAELVWEITAQTTSPTGATATVTQGVGVRVSTDAYASAPTILCP